MEVKRRIAKTLVNRLTSPSEQTLTEALSELRLLSRWDSDHRLCIADAGAIPHLTAALSSPNPTTQESAITTLLNLSILPQNRHLLLSTPAFTHSLLHLLRHPLTPAAAQNAAATVYSLCAVDSFRPILGANPGLVSALLDLARGGYRSSRTVKDSLRALFGLALYPLNRPKMVDLGAVPVLFSLLGNAPHAGVVEDATAVIAQVAGCYESVEAFGKVSGLQVLVDLLDTGTGRARENAVSALLNLAQCGGERVVNDILDSGTASTAITDLVSNGSARAKSKASALLTILVVRDQHHRRNVSDDGSVVSES